LKQLKPWFDEECSKLLDQSLQNRSQTNEENLKNLKVKSAEFSGKKGILEGKINELEIDSKNKNIRGI
jgi:hypothetical protein